MNQAGSTQVLMKTQPKLSHWSNRILFWAFAIRFSDYAVLLLLIETSVTEAIDLQQAQDRGFGYQEDQDLDHLQDQDLGHHQDQVKE